MERDASREAFGFARGVIGSTRIHNIVNKLVVIVLQRIMTPLFAPLISFILSFHICLLFESSITMMNA